MDKPALRSIIRPGLLLLAMGVLFLLMCSSDSGLARVAEAPPGPGDARPLPVLPDQPTNPDAAPGYCESYGGSTSYEYISSVTYTPNSDGTIKLVVQIFIANPDGCAPGEPCPQYDDSPEYVNVWVDWNGDQTWSESERVMDKALTGYQSINYRGTMTAVTQFSPPASVTENPTWLRANLGWSTDPNDPCTYSWSWGNVVDQQVAAQPPKIKGITAKGVGTAGEQPETGSVVRLEAQLLVPAGYQVTRCSWTGKLPPGEGDPANGCRYEYTPATGAGPADNTYGQKDVTLTIEYLHTASGATGQANMDSTYKVFFEKNGDDDNDCSGGGAGCAPNWFEYWGDDGAVTQLNNADVLYDSSLGANSYGYYDPADDKIHLGGAAAKKHYPSGINVPAVAGVCPGGNFGGAQGIDCATEVVEHEGRHKWITHNWRAGGIWVGMTDSDQGDPTADYDDDLPDSYEISTNHTLTDTVDSCDLETYKAATYKYYGDNEFAVMTYSNGKTGVADKDWANPGKQTTPPYAFLLDEEVAVGMSPNYSNPTDEEGPAGMLTSRSGPADANVSYRSSEGPIVSEMGQLTGVYADQGVDTDSDGLYDSLQLSVGVQINQAEMFNVVAWLENGSGTQIAWASSQSHFDPGGYTIPVSLDGTVIREAGFNGPYQVARVELRVSDRELLAGAADDPYTTAAYLAADFDPRDAAFGTSFSDSGIDSGSDGLYDLLRVSLNLDVHTSGSYVVIGELEGSGAIAVARSEASLAAGPQSVQIDFDGALIFQSRQDGPYHLRALRVLDGNGEPVDFVMNAYDTSAYTHTQFQHGTSVFDASSFADQGLDVDSDGDYDYLRVSFNLNAELAGAYTVMAELDDPASSRIVALSQVFDLAAGLNSLLLDFPGGAIYNHGVDGPYRLAAMSLLSPEGAILDNMPLASLTQAYSYTQFTAPLVSLSGSYTDYGVDLDSNGRFDQLNIEIGILPGDGGVVVAQGQLVDGQGNEIEWTESYSQVVAGGAGTITLSFSGEGIGNHGRNGPYQLRNLNIYNTADPDQNISLPLAYTTAAYIYTEFEGMVRIYLPVINQR